MLRGAGLAVREARRGGRNRIEVCTPELVAVADETLAIGKDLRLALQEKGLGVCYQPLVDLSHGSVLGFEALVRWTHPVHGHVSPSRFLPVAEEFGLISELGRMVLSTASAQVQQWSSTFRVPLDAHVNISGQRPRPRGLRGHGAGVPAGQRPAADQLVLEVTETTVEPDLDTARRRFDALHELGVRIALDDFGTGRSALGYLQSLAVDILKVDRSYLASIDEELPGGERGDDLLRGVISLRAGARHPGLRRGHRGRGTAAAAAPQRLRDRPGLPVRTAAPSRGRRALPARPHHGGAASGARAGERRRRLMGSAARRGPPPRRLWCVFPMA